jgi:transcriptional regulator with XRE-family HTH domain
MKDRIQRIIDDKNLTPSSFADEVGLHRPAVSHILNGRNNPGLSALQNIIKRFPEINGSWLITGFGDMYQQDQPKSEISPSLFDENHVFQPNMKESTRNEQEMTSKHTILHAQGEDYQQYTATKSKAVKVKKIAIFYTDNTYEEFIPAETH